MYKIYTRNPLSSSITCASNETCVCKRRGEKMKWMNEPHHPTQIQLIINWEMMKITFTVQILLARRACMFCFPFQMFHVHYKCLIPQKTADIAQDSIREKLTRGTGSGEEKWFHDTLKEIVTWCAHQGKSRDVVCRFVCVFLWQLGALKKAQTDRFSKTINLEHWEHREINELTPFWTHTQTCNNMVERVNANALRPLRN